MKKLYLAVCSMIVTGFLMKSYRKLQKPETEEEVYSRMRAAYARIRRRAELDAWNELGDMESFKDQVAKPLGQHLARQWRRGGSCD